MRKLLVLLAAPALLFTACGGGSKESPTGLESAVNAYSVAYLGGQGTQAHALLSARCQAQLSQTEMDSLTASAKSLYGPLPMRSFKVDSSTADVAFVSYAYTVTTLNQTHQRWTREANGWVDDTC